MFASRKLHYLFQSPFLLCFSICVDCTHFFFLFLPVFLLFSLSICTAQILQWTWWPFNHCVIRLVRHSVSEREWVTMSGVQKLLFAEFVVCQAWLNQQYHLIYCGPGITEKHLMNSHSLNYALGPISLLLCSCLHDQWRF